MELVEIPSCLCLETVIKNMQSQDGIRGSSILTLLGSGHQNLHETYQCRMYSRELMMGKEDARNM